jgi:hypothetical protein
VVFSVFWVFAGVFLGFFVFPVLLSFVISVCLRAHYAFFDDISLLSYKKISLIILSLCNTWYLQALYIYVILSFLHLYLVLYHDAYDELTRIPLQDEMGDESSSFLMRFHEVALFFIVIVCMRF